MTFMYLLESFPIVLSFDSKPVDRSVLVPATPSGEFAPRQCSSAQFHENLVGLRLCMFFGGGPALRSRAWVGLVLLNSNSRWCVSDPLARFARVSPSLRGRMKLSRCRRKSPP